MILRALVVESEFELRASLRRTLTAEGFEVVTAIDETTASRAVLAGEFDVIVLDTILTDQSAYPFLDRIRSTDIDTPVLLISTDDSEVEQVKALDAGGDGYLAIPFSYLLLVAHLRALARRHRGSWMSQQPLQLGDLHLDPSTGLATFQRQQIQLSSRECELLHALVSRPNVVMSKPELGRLIWGADHSANNSVEVHISQVRRKLYALGAGALVRTVRGHGYMVASNLVHETPRVRMRATG